MSQRKTHRKVNKPRISARYLADYMGASEQARRTIVRGCKYQPIARVVQHNEAKIIVSNFIRSGAAGTASIIERAHEIRERIADTDFERDVQDHNADYIERFAIVRSNLDLPEADFLPPGQARPIDLAGVTITTELAFRLRRTTRTNKVRIGAAMLRYAKGKPLSTQVAEWQSALLFGYLRKTNEGAGSEPELKLCLTIDAFEGQSYPAPTDSNRRFRNIEAACATIAELWPNIPPPPNSNI